jgi:FkbM family methyltransferase
MTAGKRFNSLMKKLNLELRRFPEGDLKRRLLLLSHFRINKIFDVGANLGQYVLNMRDAGYNGNFISFEPVSQQFNILNKAAKNDPRWQTVNMALGSRDEETIINIAGNSESSSLLEMMPEHTKSEPRSAYVGKEKIIVRKLDTIINDYYQEGDRILLKIDTQGFEKEVLAGAVKSLDKVIGIQLEMSLIPMYEGEMLYDEMIRFLKDKGFHLYSLENGFSDPKTGQLLQIDGIFFR